MQTKHIQMSSRSKRNIKRKSGIARSATLGGLILLVTGVALWLLFETRCLLDSTQENIDLYVELVDSNTEGQNQEAIELLVNHPYVSLGSVEFMPKEEAIKAFEEELGEDLDQLGMTNPLPNIISFNLQPTYLAEDSIQLFKAQIEASPYIQEVLYQENMWSTLGDHFQSLNIIALGLCIMFLAVAFFTISSTIRILMSNDRFIIRNMELVGASRSFIQAPYLKKGLLAGFISSGIAIAGILGVQNLVASQLGVEGFCSDNILLLMIVIFVGPFISFVSSYAAVQKYLNAEVDELYKN